jgi:serine/threonine protein kinase
VPVAVKRLFSGRHLSNVSLLEDFLREAHVLSKLRHPNLLVLYGVCLEAGNEVRHLRHASFASLYLLYLSLILYLLCLVLAVHSLLLFFSFQMIVTELVAGGSLYDTIHPIGWDGARRKCRMVWSWRLQVGTFAVRVLQTPPSSYL